MTRPRELATHDPRSPRHSPRPGFRRRALVGLGTMLGLLAAMPACASPGTEGSAAATDPPQEAAVAFVNVNVIPMDRERVLENQTVVVRDGRIAEIGPAAQVRPPAGARVVEARGKYLMPGLAEMHAHIPTPQAGEDAIDRTLFLYLAGGATTIRGMLGHPRHLELREQAARNQILSPRIYTSGPSLSGGSAPTPEAAVRMVEEQKAAGYDFLKLHPGISRPAYDAMVQAANRVGIPFAGHVPADVGLRRALEARQATIDHLDSYAEALAGLDTYDAQQTGLFGVSVASRIDMSKIPELAAATRRAGVWNVPTHSLLEHLISPEDPEVMARRPELRYMPAQTVEQWKRMKRDFRQQPVVASGQAQRYLDARRQLIRELQRQGAGLLLGSDAPQWWNVPGFSLQHELRYMVDAGLTPYQALETGTRNPAVFFGEQDRWGTVERGKAADLILLDANPLQDIANLERRAGVMVRGRWLPREEIQRRLDEIAARVGGA